MRPASQQISAASPLPDDGRRRPLIPDVVVACAMSALGFVAQPTAPSLATSAYWVVVGAAVPVVVLRRKFPQVSVLTMVALIGAHTVLVAPFGIFLSALWFLAAYSTQTQLSGRVRWATLGMLSVLLLTGLAPPTLAGALPATADALLPLAALTATLLAAGVMAGMLRRRARDEVDDALERATLREAQAEAERLLAGAEERARLARELHDILGHSLSTIAVHAEGARLALRDDPRTAEAALSTIGRLSRDSVDEIRQLLDTLRADPLTTVQGSLEKAVTQLVDDARQVGTEVTLAVEGRSAAIEPGAELAAYRIVQESLTNAAKHAAGHAVSVRLSFDEDHVRTVVSNEMPQPEATRRARTSGGQGLTGMAERARAYHGVLTAGPDPTGTHWCVTSTIPRRNG